MHDTRSSQSSGLPPHTPPVHSSPDVHTSPSSHPVPSAALGFVQAPVAESQVPATWHASRGAHTTGLAPTQLPESHVSAWVHRSPSSHGVPTARGLAEQAPDPGSQTP